jgi:hypothetical protein
MVTGLPGFAEALGLETAILNYLSGAILRCSRGNMIRAEKETALGGLNRMTPQELQGKPAYSLDD